MSTRSLVAALAGGVTLFILGGLFYVLLLPGFFETAVAKDPPAFLFIVLGEIVWGLLLAWVFSNAGVCTMAAGAKAGAVFGLLVALATGLIMYGATTVADLTYYLGDVVVFAIRYAAAGAVIGWMLEREAPAARAG